MKFDVTILGCGAALPTMRHHPTGQVVNVHDKYFLVDCGEGTQMQLRKYRIKMQRIHHVFISHLHGDHYFGFNGLISTMHLLGRTKALHVYAHEGLKTIFELQQQVGEMYLNFPVIFHELPRNETVKIYDDTTLDVHAFPLDHRIPCCGFLFREKPRKANISREVIAEYQLQFSEIIALKNGSDVSRVDGTLLRAANLTIQAPARRSYAFCSDTRYSERVIQAVKDVDLLYHEATFAEDMAARAAQTHHSTAGQAASVAAKAGVDQLIIGHFSARYLSESVLLEEAQRYFPNVHLANEGAVFSPRSRPDLSLCE